ncbi:abortive infection protein [Actinorhabdospora filicis]|uniref:Abortive infection protein n=1 Tax=Actinorhabdospora filicis TaxID=1785913 RepID=A0A9W6SM50_9ACTN|nr:CPBP family intramembrane glutamic endopeptidase [Actinorhabdospora filicis]GLZ77111.1 abortive infection protein [Actinorhabdospora filicis]
MKNGRGLAWFLGLSFIPTWVYFGVAPLYGIDMVNPLAQLPFAFMPAIAAVLVRAFITREGFADAGLRLRLKASWPYYLLAWFVPAAIAAATIGTAWAFGLVDPGQFVPDGGLPLIAGLHLLVVVLMPVFWGEEFGWTSYLRLRLFPDRPVLSTLGTGLIWAVWHWPLAFNGYMVFDSWLIGLAVWTPLMMTQEVMLAWLRMRSGSIWPTSLAHAGNNMILSWLTASVLEDAAGLDNVTVMLVMLVPMTLLSGWIILSGRLRDALTARGSSVSSRPESAAPRR